VSVHFKHIEAARLDPRGQSLDWRYMNEFADPADNHGIMVITQFGIHASK